MIQQKQKALQGGGAAVPQAFHRRHQQERAGQEAEQERQT